MRKSLPLLVILTVSAFAGSPLSVQRVLTNAVNGERLAAARYDAFAERAAADGYAGVANLFRAEARAERIHLQRFVMLMDERGLPVPPEMTPKVDVDGTDRNLQTAISSEQAERDSTYLYAINTCNEAREEKVAKIFDITRDAETEHANLCASALRRLDSYKDAKTFFVCPVCGYTTDVRLSACPACARTGSLDRID
jgi:rubrerythrin